eukprot:223458-Prorocentrum_lima.AAC.1
MKNRNEGYFWSVMGTNIKRAKKELQQEMSVSSTWSWPYTQQQEKGSVFQRGRELSSAIGAWKEEWNLIPVKLQLGQ